MMETFCAKIKNAIKKVTLLNSAARKLFCKRNSIYLGDHKALTRTIWGHKIFLDTRDISIAPHILLDGFWEMWITKVFAKTIKQGMTVVEIGSNVGYYTLLAASLIGPAGKIYAFEANSEIAEILFQSMAINGFLDRVTIINKAVSDKSGRIKFHKLKHLQGGSSISDVSEGIIKFQKYMDHVETVDVEAVSLDDYFAGNNPNIDAIKIDAEGSEALIFYGMKELLKKNPRANIICEFTPDLISGTGEDPKHFLEEIISHGFRLRIINTDSNLTDVSIDSLLTIPQCELFLSK
jgi:FkbM family methyltransferase